MANIKNFGLQGVGSNVQYGKSGGQFEWDSGNTVFRALESDGTTLSNLRVALTPLDGNDAASKNYVDTTAQGLAVKDAVRVATTSADMSQLTYNATGGPNSNGSWSYTAPLVIDGVTLADGDRVLVKDQDENTPASGNNGRGNGIFVVNATGTVLERAEDADGSPVGELRGGSFVFVQEGAVNDNAGFSISEPDGTISVGNDEITWSQFSGAGSITAGAGLQQTGTTISLDLGSLTDTAIEGADSIAFSDNSGGDDKRRSVADFINDLGLVEDTDFASNGLMVRTGSGTYANRTLTASTVAGEDGIVITDGDGATADPTIGVDITGQTPLSAEPDGTDEFLLYDSSAGENVKVTMSNVAAAAAALGVSGDLTDGDGDTLVTVEETSDADQIVLKSGLAGNGAQNIATFETANTTNNDEQFKFLNGDGEVRMEAGDAGGFASNSTNDIDIRIVPGSNGQVFIGDTGAGLVQADDDNQLTAKGGDAVAADAGDLILEGGDGTSSFASGDVILRGGTGGASEGTVFIQDSDEQNVMTFDGVGSAVNYWNATNAATGNNVDLAAEGTDTNISLTLTPKGNGTVQVPVGYESNISVDEDLVNKAYVDNQISTSAVSGATSSVEGTVDFTSATAQTIGTIPADATILRVTFRVGTASDAATEVTFGDSTNGAAAYMAATENDPEATGTYVAYDDLTDVGGSAVTAEATVTTAGSVGTGTVVIEYRNA